MSIAIINATVSGTLVVAGTTTLSGALTSSSTINVQGISVNGNTVMTGNLIVNGNTSISGNLIAGNTAITNAELGHISGSGSNIQGQLNKITINSIQSLTTGIKNFAVGDFNLPALTTGSFNSALGTDCLSQTVSGSNNIAIGKLAGGGILGSDNITIGSNTLMVAPNNFTGSTCIGKDSQISANNQIVLGTDINTVKIYGKLDISGNVSLSNSTLFLRLPTDGNHTLTYDGTSNGPALKGFLGGRLGTVSKGDILTWNTTSGINSVAVNGNTTITGNTIITGDSYTTGTIREVITGHFVNFYRKAGCGTTETYDFSATHGLYEVFYSLNHDRITTAFVYVDVVNNVNGGSYVTVVNQGAGITTSIAPSTNIFTITSSFSNGLLIINRKMAYP